MAKLNVTIAIFFCLLVFARADLPEKDDIADVSDVSEPRTTSTILLPSEKPGSEAATIVEFDHDASESQPVHHGHHSHHPEDEHGTVPLTSVNFHPINRHFSRGHGHLPFRRGHRCRHGRHHWAPRLRADDHGPHGVILSRERWGLEFDPKLRGLARRVPGRWVRVYHGKPRFGRHMDLTWPSDVKKSHHHHHEIEEHEQHHRHQAHHHNHGHHHHYVEATRESVPSGIFTKIRKFLGQF